MKLWGDEALGHREAHERYSWLQDDERLLELQRRHWFALVPKMILPTLLSLIAILVWVSLASSGGVAAAWGTGIGFSSHTCLAYMGLADCGSL